MFGSSGKHAFMEALCCKDQTTIDEAHATFYILPLANTANSAQAL